MAHKPGDQTIPAAPDFSGKKGAKSSARTDKYIKTETGWKRAVGEDMAGELFQKALTPSEAAPVVSQGAWRERAFIPRGVMARDAMLQALRDELAKVLEVGGNPARLVEPLLEAWLPVLPLGVEQAGGDSLDAWLAPLRALDPDGDPIAELTTYISAKLRMAREAPQASRLFANEILHGAPAIGGFLGGTLKRLVDEKAAVIRSWAKRGLIAPLDPHQLIFAIWATTQHYADFDAQVAAVLGGAPDWTEVERSLLALLIGGLKPR
jgi:AcrR family transcriptional regulator